MTKHVKMIVTNRASPLSLILPSGHSYVFHPDIPVPVLTKHVRECMERGVGFVNPEEEPLRMGNVPLVEQVKTQEDTRQAMQSLFVKMIQSPADYRSSFTAGGRPQVKWVSQQLNADVSASMVDEVWRDVLQQIGATPG